MIRAISFAAAIATLPNVALADGIELSRPIIAASLDEGGIDMVVYYIERDGQLEVVATYATKAEPDLIKRIRLGLSDGDTVGFHLPGQHRVSYAFIREGSVVRALVLKRHRTPFTRAEDPWHVQGMKKPRFLVGC